MKSARENIMDEIKRNSWYIKGRAEHDEGGMVPSDFFIKNNCISAGWGPSRPVFNFEDYRNQWHNDRKTRNQEKNWNNQSVHYLFELIKKGDYVWTRYEGKYYVAVIPDDPKELFHYDDSELASKSDCVVQVKNILWVYAGTEEAVPGSVSSFSKNRNSIVRIDKHETKTNGYTATSRAAAMFLKEKE